MVTVGYSFFASWLRAGTVERLASFGRMQDSVVAVDVKVSGVDCWKREVRCFELRLIIFSWSIFRLGSA